MRIVRRSIDGYSPDVMIDESGKVVFARDAAKGEAIRIPGRMFSRILSQKASDKPSE